MMSVKAGALAERLERGADALAEFAATLSDADWNARLPGDGRKVGVVVHHVASVYPLEIQIALKIADRTGVTGVTMDDVHAMNAKHASEFDAVSRDAAVDLLRRNSATAAAAIRGLTDEQLAHAERVSLYADAPVTCQFVLEDHAVRHSYHHLAGIRRALKR
jgi:DinB superfamily